MSAHLQDPLALSPSALAAALRITLAATVSLALAATLLTIAATAAIVEQAIADTGATEKCDIGKVMKAVMASHRDVIDGKLVNRLAAARL